MLQKHRRTSPRRPQRQLQAGSPSHMLLNHLHRRHLLGPHLHFSRQSCLKRQCKASARPKQPRCHRRSIHPKRFPVRILSCRSRRFCRHRWMHCYRMCYCCHHVHLMMKRHHHHHLLVRHHLRHLFSFRGRWRLLLLSSRKPRTRGRGDCCQSAPFAWEMMMRARTRRVASRPSPRFDGRR